MPKRLPTMMLASMARTRGVEGRMAEGEEMEAAAMGNHQPEARQNRECLLRQTVQHVLLVRFSWYRLR